MTGFQAKLLKGLQRGVWYDVFRLQGTGGAALPGWFYLQQSEPMDTIRPIIKAKILGHREVGEARLPQVRRMRAVKRRA